MLYYRLNMDHRMGLGLKAIMLLGLYHSAIAQKQTDLIVTTILDEPFLIEENVNNAKVYKGFNIDVLDALSRRTGFNFTLKLAADNRYGAKDDQGKWNGMMGDLVRKEADVAMMLTMTQNRISDVDFTQPVLRVYQSVVLEKPTYALPWKERLERLLEPIEPSVWILLVLAFMFTSVLLFIVSSLNPREWRALGKKDEASVRESETFTCLNTLWFVISTMFWQGYVRAPRSIGGRLITTGWFSFVLIFILSYLACLINLIPVIPEPIFSINSFSELAEDDSFVIGVLPDSSSLAYLQSASPGTAQAKLYERASEFVKDTDIKTGEEGIKLITNRPDPKKGFAWVMESSAASALLNKQCSLYMVSDRFTNRFTGIAAQLNSPILDDLNSALLEIQETGELSMIENRWFRSQQCQEKQETKEEEVYEFPEFFALDLATFSGAVFILVIGLGLGCLITPLEYWFIKRSNKSESNGSLVEATPTPVMKDGEAANHIPLTDADPALDVPDGPQEPSSKRESLIGTSTQV